MLERSNSQVKLRNPAEVLLDEEGVFEMTSPRGEVFRVTCRRRVGMTFIQADEGERRTGDNTIWRIRRMPSKSIRLPARSRAAEPPRQ
jgi:hypothetical protein